MVSLQLPHHLRAGAPLAALAASFFIMTTSLSTAAAPLSPIPLWSGTAPGALGNADNDIPTITPYLPDPAKATGAALVIFPGGGYGHLATHEGAGYAEWLAENGIAGLVVKYRLGSNGYRHPVMLEDGLRAVRLARAQAPEWKIDPHRVGIIGSSAGGHLASTVLTHFDAGKPGDPDPVERESSRPDLGILCYAVISMDDSITHQGSKKNLLGDHPGAQEALFVSSEKQVKADTPPCFIWHTWEDKSVKVENALAFAEALRAKNIPFELHIYEKGGHGIGLGKAADPTHLHRWNLDCLAWLKDRGFAH